MAFLFKVANSYHQQGPKLMITWNTTASAFTERWTVLWKKQSVSLQLGIGIVIYDLYSQIVELPFTAPGAWNQI